jgi:hypothetical protein
MNRPPYLMRVKINEPDTRRINLWIPLFLIFPVAAVILIVIMLILAPFVLLATIILWRFEWFRLLLLSVPLVLRCLCSLRGLEVNVSNGNEKVFISIK